MAALSVTTTAQQVPAGWSDLQNLGTAPVYLGNDNTVSSSSGIRLDPGGTLSRRFRANDLWVVTGAGTQDVRYII